ncbi:MULTISPECIES: transposase [Rhizobium]|uniref:Transcriptional regulator n=1 Tax=Rhizobium favelukesii TaxID=348824 RepID=W6S7E3_9HYPH|nr:MULTISPECIES: transposase [Rhizobium]MCA0805836.1 transposase [Rhizobium sp. T1473]MCS0459681.1 transposase [Rhizobium favelukesii]UFS80311.1 transposase [Rhizobium sp. T136]CDM62121.1 hypothetical protein LPU83_pLPU83d_0751 [Rhizobium favelukesii]
MADESETGPIAIMADTDGEVKIPAPKKERSPRGQKTAAQSPHEATQATAPKAPAAKPRKHTDKEKIEKLKLIEMQASGGSGTLKDAIKKAGISEQTYYLWKRAAKPVQQPEQKSVAAVAAFEDLVQLEQENLELRKALAAKLRTENAELRKRLGLD